MEIFSDNVNQGAFHSTFFRAENAREALINCLHKQIAALAGAQKLAYLFDMSRFLRSIRLALCLLGELFSTSQASRLMQLMLDYFKSADFQPAFSP